MSKTLKPLQRREVVKQLLADRGDLLVVGGLGAPAWDITDAGDDPLNFPLWGGMGGAVMIGLGLALAQPGRKVLVITGDGEMLMGLGSLATVGITKPENLSVVVLDNEVYGETGQQKTHTAYAVDLAAAARACGFVNCSLVTEASGIAPLRAALHASEGPIFAQVKISPEQMPLVLPPRDGTLLKNRFREALLGPEAHTAN
ncbi:MAG: thiamine pyrophosphate-dependent enzyme [Burkholderiales bacterium]|jgi:thiamine pyrophosphate-dependent acetolactate synthase large subunit-like protein